MFERVRFGGFSGTYRIDGELARDRKIKTLNVSVLFLDDSSKTFQIEVSQDIETGRKREILFPISI
jgi:hypothetical protein